MEEKYNYLGDFTSVDGINHWYGAEGVRSGDSDRDDQNLTELEAGCVWHSIVGSAFQETMDYLSH